jgi:hypothetical protein
MNTMPFLNPYQMALIEKEYRYATDIYTKEYRPLLNIKVDEYLMEFFTGYYNVRGMPTIEAVREIHTQVRILYRITKEKEYPVQHLHDCVLLLAERAEFPSIQRVTLAYCHLVAECRYAVRDGQDSFLADKEKCEVFIRNGWLSEKARYPECISARHEPRYEVFYKEDFAIYKDTVNDCVCQ